MEISFVVTGLVTSVPLILAAAALMGYGWTFKSGAINAWLADEVGPERLGHEYQRGAQIARIFTLAGDRSCRRTRARGSPASDRRRRGRSSSHSELSSRSPCRSPDSSPRHPTELSALRSMARTARRGGRLIRARPILLLILGITFFGGMWSESVDRLWEAHFLRNIGVPAFAGFNSIIWFGILNAVAVVLAIVVAQPLSRRFAHASWRGMTWSLFWLDSIMVVTTVAFAFAGNFGAAVLAYWGICVARSLSGPVYSTWLNANIEDSSVRATVISMTNLGDSPASGEADPHSASWVMRSASAQRSPPEQLRLHLLFSSTDWRFAAATSARPSTSCRRRKADGRAC